MTTPHRADRRTRDDTDVVFAAGDVVADHTIDAFLGSGSSAEVYRVHTASHPEPLALKVLHTRSSDQQRIRERFEREFSIASLLDHPNIVHMHARGELDIDELGVDNRTPATVLWMTMEYVAGMSANELVGPHPTQAEVAATVEIGRQIADALDYAHSCEVLHRDVKPANIIVSTASTPTRAVLTDFGIAQLLDDARPLARNGRVQGSIAYAAPELLTASRISPATDQYALAASLFELLTGEPPFPRATAFAITYAHLHDPIPRLTKTQPWLPSALNSVFAKALAKNPADRYPTCAEFTDIVRRALLDVPVPTPQRRRWWSRRAKPLVE
ncbi:serine/threonine-protein kinase [Gordonia sp. LSe1-13]|uniref:non-specific serine/threonine protein kinase n=1 Tax=Gordonia sesuvii TaxID=3116777 RepID=A0ABU7MIM1_9ACTN|nr:serine/threonine-protein kinase [Gordonia sp. LSe1-13]